MASSAARAPLDTTATDAVPPPPLLTSFLSIPQGMARAVAFAAGATSAQVPMEDDLEAFNGATLPQGADAIVASVVVPAAAGADVPRAEATMASINERYGVTGKAAERVGLGGSGYKPLSNPPQTVAGAGSVAGLLQSLYYKRAEHLAADARTQDGGIDAGGNPDARLLPPALVSSVPFLYSPADAANASEGVRPFVPMWRQMVNGENALSSTLLQLNLQKKYGAPWAGQSAKAETHCATDRTKFWVPREQELLFIQHYASAIQEGTQVFLVERLTTIFHMFADFDFKSAHPLTEQDIAAVVWVTQATVRKFFAPRVAQHARIVRERGAAAYNTLLHATQVQDLLEEDTNALSAAGSAEAEAALAAAFAARDAADLAAARAQLDACDKDAALPMPGDLETFLLAIVTTTAYKREPPREKNGLSLPEAVKTGVHVHWPNLLVTAHMAQQMLEMWRCALEQAFGERTEARNQNSWNDVCDGSVYGKHNATSGSGMRMLGASKAEVCSECDPRVVEKRAKEAKRAAEREQVARAIEPSACGGAAERAETAVNPKSGGGGGGGSKCGTCGGTGRLNQGRPYHVMMVVGGSGRRDVAYEVWLTKQTFAVAVMLTKVRAEDATADARAEGWAPPPNAPLYLEDDGVGAAPRRRGTKLSAHEKEVAAAERALIGGNRADAHWCNRMLEPYSPIPALLQAFITRHMDAIYKDLVVKQIKTNEAKSVYHVYVSGLMSHFCGNVQREHASNRIYIEVTPRGASQRCWDSSDERSPLHDLTCREWASARVPLTPSLEAALFQTTARQKAQTVRAIMGAEEEPPLPAEVLLGGGVAPPSAPPARGDDQDEEDEEEGSGAAPPSPSPFEQYAHLSGGMSSARASALATTFSDLQRNVTASCIHRIVEVANPLSMALHRQPYTLVEEFADAPSADAEHDDVRDPSKLRERALAAIAARAAIVARNAGAAAAAAAGGGGAENANDDDDDEPSVMRVRASALGARAANYHLRMGFMTLDAANRADAAAGGKKRGRGTSKDDDPHRGGERLPVAKRRPPRAREASLMALHAADDETVGTYVDSVGVDASLAVARAALVGANAKAFDVNEALRKRLKMLAAAAASMHPDDAEEELKRDGGTLGGLLAARASTRARSIKEAPPPPHAVEPQDPRVQRRSGLIGNGVTRRRKALPSGDATARHRRVVAHRRGAPPSDAIHEDAQDDTHDDAHDDALQGAGGSGGDEDEEEEDEDGATQMPDAVLEALGLRVEEQAAMRGY